MQIGGLSQNELIAIGAVAGGAYLLYNFKGATDQLDAVEDDDGCPADTSVSSVVGMVAEPWAYTRCFANKIEQVDPVQVAQTVDEDTGDFIDSVEQNIAVAFGIQNDVMIAPNVKVEQEMKTSDFQAWIDYSNSIGQKATPDAYGCVDTLWLPPLPTGGGKGAIVGKICNDNSGCYQEAYGKSGKTISDWGKILDSGAMSCGIAADNNTIAILDVNAVKVNPLPIPLASGDANSLQSQFGVKFDDLASFVNPNWKPPPKGFTGYQSAKLTFDNMNSLWHANPQDDPTFPIPPGGWK